MQYDVQYAVSVRSVQASARLLVLLYGLKGLQCILVPAAAAVDFAVICCLGGPAFPCHAAHEPRPAESGLNRNRSERATKSCIFPSAANFSFTLTKPERQPKIPPQTVLRAVTWGDVFGAGQQDPAMDVVP
eukprot:COSAG01_NODE_27696_length_679_cov_0.951724_1_plen_131_part_10